MVEAPDLLPALPIVVPATSVRQCPGMSTSGPINNSGVAASPSATRTPPAAASASWSPSAFPGYPITAGSSSLNSTASPIPSESALDSLAWAAGTFTLLGGLFLAVKQA